MKKRNSEGTRRERFLKPIVAERDENRKNEEKTEYMMRLREFEAQNDASGLADFLKRVDHAAFWGQSQHAQYTTMLVMQKLEIENEAEILANFIGDSLADAFAVGKMRGLALGAAQAFEHAKALFWQPAEGYFNQPSLAGASKGQEARGEIRKLYNLYKEPEETARQIAIKISPKFAEFRKDNRMTKWDGALSGEEYDPLVYDEILKIHPKKGRKQNKSV